MKISIITINYNNVEGLKKTVESVVNQSSKVFEYIVIDGGSADGSAEYLLAHNENLNYWVSEPDKGIYNAMNKGILQARGDYFLFLNSGDILVDDKEIINKIVLTLNHQAVYYAPIYLKKNNLTESKIEYPENLDERFLFTNTICQQAVIYHKSLFVDNVFDEKLKYISDWKMHFSLFKSKTKFIHFNIPFAIYDLNGLTSKGATKYNSHKERLKVQFLEFPFYFFKYYGKNWRVQLKLLKILFKIN
ncbi:glycosyltransferase [Flavobacterium cheongpyeongense]|jgi:glycosyltransferase involved in cell wall biosynthesis|uniref:Glycosyltransferase n=1 Tax=Flavobacterium cheongpyeongense TaxID=2212651 RepID=A0A2V4BWC3_9FLAO|nr:glycosyltransferase family 2 protein [Flavobacterium cheongpyeongense]PXY42010.1 glycosyltransferase [Flavobacterium cheongpyeongense]